MNYARKKEIFDGVVLDDLKRIDEVSAYNHNYYIYKGFIILGESDDDQETEWFLINNFSMQNLIGYSYVCDSPEKIIVTSEMHT